MPGPIYTLENVQAAYEGRVVLDIAEFEVRRAEILAVVGPSGAGKSTLLRHLNFLETPLRGRLVFDGTPADGRVPLEQRRRVTTVFQQPVMLRRSVLANLGFGAALQGAPVSRAVLLEWAERLGLAGLAGQSARSLSAGEAQRVAVARALVTRPDVLLLDEPTANLDPANVVLIESLVREEHAARGTTIVLVTHNVFQARRLADRTALLLAGRVVEAAVTEDFFERPTQAVTAAFLRGELF